MAGMTLYHTGFQEIRQPDLHRGRANADFGLRFVSAQILPEAEISGYREAVRKEELVYQRRISEMLRDM